MGLGKKSFIVKCHDVEGVGTQFGTEVRMLMHPDFANMDRDVSVLWVTLPPGTSTGRHNHPDQAEYEYIVSGKGVLKAGDLGDEDNIPVEAFMLVLNPPGLYHNVDNTGTETMYLLRFHVPSLPNVSGSNAGKAIEAARRSMKQSR